MCIFLIIKTKTVAGQEPTAFWRCVDVGSWGWMGGSPGPWPFRAEPHKSVPRSWDGLRANHQIPQQTRSCILQQSATQYLASQSSTTLPRGWRISLGCRATSPPFQVIMGPSSPSWRCDLLHGIGAAHGPQSHVSARHDRTSSRLFPPYSILDTQSAMGRICGAIIYMVYIVYREYGTVCSCSSQGTLLVRRSLNV